MGKSEEILQRNKVIFEKGRDNIKLIYVKKKIKSIQPLDYDNSFKYAVLLL